MPEEWIPALVADFGSECRERLRVSDTEASISLPVAKLVEAFGARWKLSPRLHPGASGLRGGDIGAHHRLPGTEGARARRHARRLHEADREQWEVMRGPRWPGTSPVPAGTTRARRCARTRARAAVTRSGFPSVTSAESKAGMPPSPCSASSKLSNLVFGAGDAV